MLRIDAHQHFWDPARADYPWMTDAVAPIRRAFAPDDLRPHIAAASIERTILVQTIASRAETEAFLALASAEPFIAGVVGWIDLTTGREAGDIEDLRRLPGGDALVGIRHQAHDEPDPKWLLRDDVGRGIAAVGAAGLAFDLLVRERELPAAIAVARRYPEVRFVLDHVAKPPIAARTMPAGWRAGIEELAELPNVWCKISGLVTEADWHAWTDDDLQPYVAHAAAAFGPQRLIFGSDWPVCLLASSYERVHDVARRLLAALVPDESALEGIFGATAAAVYEL